MSQHNARIRIFPKIHKVGNVGIFVLLKFENKLNATISHINIILKYHHKCKFAWTFIQFSTNSNIFPLEIVQKWQHCQLYVLRKNSIGSMALFFSVAAYFWPSDYCRHMQGINSLPIGVRYPWIQHNQQGYSASMTPLIIKDLGACCFPNHYHKMSHLLCHNGCS